MSQKSIERALLSMNEILLCGLDELDEARRALLVAHVMNEHNWAAPRNVRKRNRTSNVDRSEDLTQSQQFQKGKCDQT